MEADSKYAKSFEGTWEVLVTEREWHEAPGRPGPAQRLLLAPGEMLELSRAKLSLGGDGVERVSFPRKGGNMNMVWNIYNL